MPLPKKGAKKPPRVIRRALPSALRKAVFSYKHPEILRRFVNEQGYIVGRDRTGLTQKQQRLLGQEIKRARHLALLPFTQTI